MGATASLTDEIELFNKVRLVIDEDIIVSQEDRESDWKNDDEWSENDDNEEAKLDNIPNKQQRNLYCKTNDVYQTWLYSMQLKESVMRTSLVDFEHSLETAFATGRTPLISDCSTDDKICTFYSYQTDAIILETKVLIVDSMRRSTLHCLDLLRKSLVNAMKFGKLLVIRLDTATPDFLNKWNDESQKINYEVEKLGYFPLEALLQGGKALHSEDWYAKLLFRDEDMRPHKNVAFCRDGFRVCLVSKLSVEDMHKLLFGLYPPITTDNHNLGTTEARLPDKSNFQIISIEYEEIVEENTNDEMKHN